jgi:hypothetical protein
MLRLSAAVKRLSAIPPSLPPGPCNHPGRHWPLLALLPTTRPQPDTADAYEPDEETPAESCG